MKTGFVRSEPFPVILKGKHLSRILLTLNKCWNLWITQRDQAGTLFLKSQKLAETSSTHVSITNSLFENKKCTSAMTSKNLIDEFIIDSKYFSYGLYFIICDWINFQFVCFIKISKFWAQKSYLYTIIICLSLWKKTYCSRTVFKFVICYFVPNVSNVVLITRKVTKHFLMNDAPVFAKCDVMEEMKGLATRRKIIRDK